MSVAYSKNPKFSIPENKNIIYNLSDWHSKQDSKKSNLFIRIKGFQQIAEMIKLKNFKLKIPPYSGKPQD